MLFKLWLESADNTLQSIKNKILSIINSAPDYNTASSNLQKLGIEQPEDGKPIGTDWADKIYRFIAQANPHATHNPELEEKMDSVVKQIPNSFHNIKKLKNDETNTWNSFTPVPINDNTSSAKLYIKIPDEEVDKILQVAKIISSNPNLVRQFKFSYTSQSFSKRRDNFIIYLTKEGENQESELKKQINSIGLTAEKGADITTSFGNVSGTQAVAHELSEELLKKPGAPEARYSRGSSSELMKILRDKKEAPSKVEKNSHLRIQLMPVSGSPISLGTPLTIGSTILKFPEGKFYAPQQFQLAKDGDFWAINPLPNTPNATFVNTTPITSKVHLKPNDVISVGNPTNMKTVGGMKVNFV
jgi:hypothetical protein